MQILREISAYHPAKGRPLILGIGNFDGLHRGHQALIGHVLHEARTCRGVPALLTFRTHPQHVLHPAAKPRLLFSGAHKLFLFAQSGIQLCFWLDFTPALARTDPVVFVRDWLFRRLGVREICMGYNARFGRDRKGDGALMGLLSRELGFKFSQIPPVKAAGETVSSSRIRRLVEAGELNDARDCLGRAFSVLGRVVRGAGRGKSLGYPTANLELESRILPPAGVYPVWVRRVGGLTIKPGKDKVFNLQPKLFQWVKGVLNLGIRPTFEDGKAGLQLEVFLLDYRGPELYGAMLEVAFENRLREEKKFADAAGLARQIKKDCVNAERRLSRRPG